MGRADHRGLAANPVSSRPVVAAVLLVTNRSGLGDRLTSPCRSARGAGRNGPRTTVLSGPDSRADGGVEECLRTAGKFQDAQDRGEVLGGQHRAWFPHVEPADRDASAERLGVRLGGDRL